MRRGDFLEESPSEEGLGEVAGRVLRGLMRGAKSAGINTADPRVQAALIQLGGVLSLDETMQKAVDTVRDHVRDLKRQGWS